jgi:hypothetical protein
MSIAKLFLKKRYLLAINSNDFKKVPQIFNKKIIIKNIVISTLTNEVFSFLNKKIRKETIKNRINKNNCDLFVAYLKGNSNPVGYYWAITTENGEKWHDSFKIPQKSALLFNAFVAEECRNFGVYSHLIFFAQEYLYKNKNIINIYTIVEQNNFPSLKANLNTGSKMKGENFLIKFFGSNVVSIFLQNNHYSLFIMPFLRRNLIK